MGASSRGFSPRSISAIFIGQGSVRLDARGKDTQKNATHRIPPPLPSSSGFRQPALLPFVLSARLLGSAAPLDFLLPALPVFFAPALRSVCPAPRFPPPRSLPAAPCFRSSVSPYFPFPPCTALPPASPRPPPAVWKTGKRRRRARRPSAVSRVCRCLRPVIRSGA